MKFTERLAVYQARVEAALDRWLPAATEKPESLNEAVRYAVFGGGKRVRPVLVYAGGEAFNAEPAALDGCACAVEMIHTYSLIHDDLPAMDDDDLRRGRPTCHKAYNEATAILAGDALQALAFQVLAQDPAIAVPAGQRIRMIDTLARAAGPAGMTGGQAIDLEAENRVLSLEELQDMHARKTGALIRASVELGALCAGNVDEQRFRTRSRATRTASAWLFKSTTTCSISRAIPKPWVNPRAPTWSGTRPPTPTCSVLRAPSARRGKRWTTPLGTSRILAKRPGCCET